MTNWWETLLSEIWSPTSVCTQSREIKKIIGSYLIKTGDIDQLPFKLHDFGLRGISSPESAGLSGVAHLVNFLGTDNGMALEFGRQFYDCLMAGFSIAAAEHSTITTWGGPENEIDAFRNMIRQFGGHGGDGSGLYAVVSDSWDFFDACKTWSGELHQEVMDAPNKLIVRPDSGTPHVIVVQGLETLDENERGGFGHWLNDKGYKILVKEDPGHVGMLQGDGMDLDETRRVLEAMTIRKWSTNNIAFGMGGGLIQKLDRDTQQCAWKACYIEGDGWEREVFKRPVTDHTKKSKGGKLHLVNVDGTLETVNEKRFLDLGVDDVLEDVWECGELLRDQTLEEIREIAEVTEFEGVLV